MPAFHRILKLSAYATSYRLNYENLPHLKPNIHRIQKTPTTKPGIYLITHHPAFWNYPPHFPPGNSPNLSKARISRIIRRVSLPRRICQPSAFHGGAIRPHFPKLSAFDASISSHFEIVRISADNAPYFVTPRI